MSKIRNTVLFISLVIFLTASSLSGLTVDEQIKTNRFMATNPPVFYKTSVPNTKLTLINAKSLEFGGVKSVPAVILQGSEFIGYAPDKSEDTFEFRLRNQGLLKTVRTIAIGRDEKTRTFEHEDYEIKVEFSQTQQSVLYDSPTKIKVFVVNVVSITKMKPDGPSNTNQEQKTIDKNNNILRQWVVVALKLNKLATSFQKEGIAVDINEKPFVVGSGKENIKLIFNGTTTTKPAKFNHDGYSVAGLTPGINPRQIEVQIGAFSKNYQIPQSSGIVSDIIPLSDGQYEIKINFKKENGTWMLLPKGTDRTPADAYFISIESITKIAETKTDEIIKDIKAQQAIAENAQKTAETAKTVADAENAVNIAKLAVANAKSMALKIPGNQEAATAIRQAEIAFRNAEVAVKKLRDAEIAKKKAADESVKPKASEAPRQETPEERLARFRDRAQRR